MEVTEGSDSSFVLSHLNSKGQTRPPTLGVNERVNYSCMTHNWHSPICDTIQPLVWCILEDGHTSTIRSRLSICYLFIHFICHIFYHLYRTPFHPTLYHVPPDLLFIFKVSTKWLLLNSLLNFSPYVIRPLDLLLLSVPLVIYVTRTPSPYGLYKLLIVETLPHSLHRFSSSTPVSPLFSVKQNLEQSVTFLTPKWDSTFQ